MDLSIIIGLIGTLIALSSYYANNMLNPKMRRAYLGAINIGRGAYELRYYRLIAGLLRIVHNIFANAISQKSFFLSITWALLYSSLIFLISWLLFGVEKIGNTKITEIKLDQFLRIGIGIAFVLSIFFILSYFKLALHGSIKQFVNVRVLRRYQEISCFAKKVAYVFFSTYERRRKAVQAIDDWSNSTVFGGLVAMLISAFAFSLFAGIFLVGSWFFSTAVALSFYLALSIFFAAYQLEKDDGPASQWFIRGVVAAFLVAFFLSSTGDYSVLLFVFVFPIINGFHDWLSISLSRYFAFVIIRKRKISYTLTLILLDLVFAYIFLAAIVVSFSFALEYINGVSASSSPFPIQSMLNLMRKEAYTNGFWMLFMLFSTLIPTYVHLVLACLHLFFIKTPGQVKDVIRKNLEGDGPYGVSVALFTAYTAASLAVPSIVFYSIFQVHLFASDSVAGNLFSLAESAASFARSSLTMP